MQKLNLELDFAVTDNNLDAVRKLIDQGADPLYYDEELFETAIQSSARKGYVEIFTLLFEKIGKNANVKIPYSGSLLISACSNSNAELEIVRALVENGAEVNFQNEEAYTALHFALVFANKDIVDYLLEKSAKLNLVTKDQTSVLHLLADRLEFYGAGAEEVGLYRRLVIESIKQGLSIDHKDEAGNTALFACLDSGNDLLFKILLEQGADLTQTNIDGDTIGDLLDNNPVIKVYNLVKAK